MRRMWILAVFVAAFLVSWSAQAQSPGPRQIIETQGIETGTIVFRPGNAIQMYDVSVKYGAAYEARTGNKLTWQTIEEQNRSGVTHLWCTQSFPNGLVDGCSASNSGDWKAQSVMFKPGSTITIQAPEKPKAPAAAEASSVPTPPTPPPPPPGTVLEPDPPPTPPVLKPSFLKKVLAWEYFPYALLVAVLVLVVGFFSRRTQPRPQKLERDLQPRDPHLTVVMPAAKLDGPAKAEVIEQPIASLRLDPAELLPLLQLWTGCARRVSKLRQEQQRNTPSNSASGSGQHKLNLHLGDAIVHAVEDEERALKTVRAFLASSAQDAPAHWVQESGGAQHDGVVPQDDSTEPRSRSATEVEAAGEGTRVSFSEERTKETTPARQRTLVRAPDPDQSGRDQSPATERDVPTPLTQQSRQLPPTAAAIVEDAPPASRRQPKSATGNEG